MSIYCHRDNKAWFIPWNPFVVSSLLCRILCCNSLKKSKHESIQPCKSFPLSKTYINFETFSSYVCIPSNTIDRFACINFLNGHGARERKRERERLCVRYIADDAIIAHWSQIQSRTKTEYISKVKSNCDEVKLTRTSSSFTSVESRLPLQCRRGSPPVVQQRVRYQLSPASFVQCTPPLPLACPPSDHGLSLLPPPPPLPAAVPLPEQRGRGKRLNRYITSYLTVDTVTRPSAS